MRAGDVRLMKGDLRCVDGRVMRHDPQDDDPYLETDIGQCPDCEGTGCSDYEEDDEIIDDEA